MFLQAVSADFLEFVKNLKTYPNRRQRFVIRERVRPNGTKEKLWFAFDAPFNIDALKKVAKKVSTVFVNHLIKNGYPGKIEQSDVVRAFEILSPWHVFMTGVVHEFRSGLVNFL